MAFKEIGKKVVGEYDVFRFEKVGDRIEGEYLGHRTVDPPGIEPFVGYQLKPKDKKAISFSGGDQLKELEKVAIGTTIRVTYNGKITTKRNRTMNDFTIEVDESEAA